MRGPSRSVVRLAVVGLAILAGIVVVVSAPRPAAATEFDIEAPSQSTVGEVVHVTAVITDDGEPVAAAEVAVVRHAVIGGESGWVQLDVGTSDDTGSVDFEFTQRAGSSEVERLRIEYRGPDGVDAEEFELGVLAGTQQVNVEAGPDVGIVNSAWLVIVLGVIWVSLLAAVAKLVVISRARAGAKALDHVVPSVMFAFVALTAMGMFVVVLTRPATHDNFAPRDAYDRLPTAYLGEEYDYLGLGSNDATTRPDDLTGEVLYVRTGCASCHGLGGNGAIVGGDITAAMVDDTEEMVDSVRRGPKGMPTFSEAVLSDAEIQRIVDYLREADDRAP